MIWILAVVAGAYVAVCVLAYALQERLVYYPGPPPTATPAAIGAPFEEWSLTSADGVRLHGWRVRAPAARGTVLVCHGNAGSIEHRLELAEVFVAMQLDVVLFDYRGYGKSGGKISEQGTYIDAQTFYDELVTRGVPRTQIAVYGESLGGAVAIELARRNRLAALAIEDTFSSLVDMGNEVYPWLPVRWITRIRYDSMAKIAELEQPLLVIHSPDDDLVPIEQGRRLFEAARCSKQFLETRGGHNAGGFRQDPRWIQAVERFFAQALEQP